MPAPSVLKGLPKPLLFALYGAVGGLLGAVLLGEPLWRLLQPPPPPPPPAPEPAVAVSSSAAVQLYPNAANAFLVRVARAEFDGPVNITFSAVQGVSIPDVTVPVGRAEAEAIVTASPDARPGTTKVTVTASGAGGKATATATLDVVVAQPPPPPPRLAVAVAPNITVFKRGTSRVPVQIARGDFDGPVSVALDKLPAGVTAAPLVIPAGKAAGELVLTAGETAAPAAGFVAALTAAAEAAPGRVLKEMAATKISVLDPPKAPVDIMFALDCSGSMEPFIEGCRDGIIDFAKELSSRQLDFRVGLLAFRDRPFGQEPELMTFEKGEPFTADAELFSKRVGRLRCVGNNTVPESALDGVVEAARQPFRQEATKVLILITDAEPLVPDLETKTVGEAADVLKKKGIDQLHTVLRRADRRAYDDLTGAVKGTYFDLERVRRGEKFAAILPEVSKTIARDVVAKPVPAAVAKAPDPPVVPAGEAARPAAAAAAKAPDPPVVKSLQSSERYAAGSEKQLVARSGLWAGAIAALVCLALLAGQHHYLRGSLPGMGSVAAGLVGGLIAGLIGGAAGQGLYQLFPNDAFRILGWAILGGLAGVGLSFFIPNMKWILGLAGGAVGGAAGAAGFLAVSEFTGDLVGRLVGGLVVGLCIGLMVAVVEAAFRRAWLEVRYGTRETITVNLGPEPVKVGGDARLCTVWARGAPEVALRYFVRDGQVVCDDAVMRRETVAADGFAKEVGNVTVTVRTGGGSGAPVAPPSPRSVPKRVPAAKAEGPLSLDDDFDPLPMAATPTAPAAVAPRPTPGFASGSRPPLPPPPKPVAPSVPPRPAPTAKSAPAAAKGANACPSCGRVNAGAKGTRYCMVCDQTY